MRSDSEYDEALSTDVEEIFSRQGEYIINSGNYHAYEA